MALTVTKARAVLASIRTRVPGSVVTVTSGAESAEAVRQTVAANTAGDGYGERGLTTGTLHLSLGDMTEPARGATIAIDGNDAFVTQARSDPASAILAIDYQDQNPVE